VPLAEEAWARWDPLAARRHLAAYRAETTPDVLQEALRDRAGALEAAIDRRLLQAGAAGGGGLLLALGAPLALWLARRRRGTVDDLLARDPGAWREVARLAGTVRHEILKHHTSVLDAVADALEAGDPTPAAWAAERLSGEEGALARARRLLDRLRELGRRCGVPLNLTADPTFGPLVQGLDRLERLVGALARGRAGAATELRAVSALLHARAYPALGALIHRLAVLRLDEDLVREAWERVCDEPALDGRRPPDLQVLMPGPPVHLRIWRDDCLDILVNLLRNAAQATLEHGGGAVTVRLVVEEDPITFLERVAIRVADPAPRRISTGMIRSRYIDRGLGLTVDLISRNGGAIHVEDDPDHPKAVVVRLPVVEAPPPPEDA